MSRLYKYIKTEPWLLVQIIVGSLIGNICLLLGPKLIGRAIDYLALKAGVIDTNFLKLLVSMTAVFVVAVICRRLALCQSGFLSANLIQKLRCDTYRQLQLLPLSFFYGRDHGDISSLLATDIDQINDGLVLGLPQLFSGVVTLLGSLYLMASIDLYTTVLLVVLTPLSFLVSSVIAKRSRQQYLLESQTRGELNGLAEELISNHSLVRALTAKTASIEDYALLNRRLYTCGRAAQFYSSLTNPCTRLVNAVAYILIGVLASYLALHQRISVGAIASLLAYAHQFSQPINEITSITTKLQAAVASTERISEILDLPTEDLHSGTELTVRSGHVQFQDVDFSYQPDKPLIDNLNLTIEPGQRIAIVGPTGAGKTTLVNLLLRFYEPTAGRILIDGQDIAEVSRYSLRQQVGMVLQDIRLFKLSIFENIACAKPGATLAEVQECCRRIGADEFIRRLPNGYDTVYGEGCSLSRGQEQLLSLARVVLQDPPILILDEATSNIDTRTELIVQRVFTEIMQNKTGFIIAHRLSTVTDADLILVMQAGDIVEAGSFAELNKGDTLFSKLYQSQFLGQQL